MKSRIRFVETALFLSLTFIFVFSVKNRLFKEDKSLTTSTRSPAFVAANHYELQCTFPLEKYETTAPDIQLTSTSHCYENNQIPIIENTSNGFAATIFRKETHFSTDFIPLQKDLNKILIRFPKETLTLEVIRK